MSATQPLASPIVPVHRLPANARRLDEGGRRLNRQEAGPDQAAPMISVVTVVLNGAQQLERTINSVLKQLDDKTEYIIIDGGSKDATGDIIRSCESRLEYWVSEPDQGISEAFNKGLSLCRGEVVGLLNAGDWYEDGALAFAARFFGEESDADVVCGALQYWQGADRAYIAEPRPELLYKEMSVTHPTCFVRREMYLRHGGFDPAWKYAMDYELFLRFFARGVVLRSTKQILAHMLHEGVSEQNWRDALAETRRARQKYLPGSFFAGRLYLDYLVARKYVRFGLEALGMNRLVRFYRERLAPVRKRLSP